ncbi:uncharacterized protein LOC114289936, partial [Camellia sinensis]|uniref:uncharacterized protein LOC114289936 n=1 Tax=Camellia sinensis TaxID=4442 RepID=UPI001035F4EC
NERQSNHTITFYHKTYILVESHIHFLSQFVVKQITLLKHLSKTETPIRNRLTDFCEQLSTPTQTSSLGFESPIQLGSGPSLGALIAGGAAAAAAAYGAHQLSQGAHNLTHGGFYGRQGKFKRGKHGRFGKRGGKFRKWK